MAPELVAKKDYLGQPVDIWALGVLLYKMLTGYYPFNGNFIFNINSNLIQAKLKMNFGMLLEQANLECLTT